MMRWRVALLAGSLAGSATLFFGLLAQNCTIATLLLRGLVSVLLFAVAGYLGGWALEKNVFRQPLEASSAEPLVGRSVDLTSEPLDEILSDGAETGFQPLTAADLGDVTGHKRK